MAAASRLRPEIHALTKERWPDLERLFGKNGACGGCWCMTMRQSSREYARNKGEPNRRLLRARAGRTPPPGVLAYVDGEPVAWCAVAPRLEFTRLSRSRVLAPVDDAEVWSIACLFLARAWRRRGLSQHLIQGAVALARRHGAKLVEAYPIDPTSTEVPDVFAWTGIASTFRKCGFREVARRTPTRPIMRRRLRPVAATD